MQTMRALFFSLVLFSSAALGDVSRETFERISHQPAGKLFRLRKSQPSRTNPRGTYYLVENGESEAQLKRFIFYTPDEGATWRMTALANRRNPANESAIDLAALDAEPPAAAAPASPHGMPSLGTPLFKIIFDLALLYRPGLTPITFDNYHSYVLVDFIPKPDIQFSFELTQRYFYELNYHLSPSVTLRAGRIFIPFDQMDPHNIYGGRVNTSRLAADPTSLFLPDLWTDLGLGVKINLADSVNFTLDVSAYVVNGFGNGGYDPVKAAPSQLYPNFSNAPTSDNNNDKALGFRMQGKVAGVVGFGASIYEGRYTNENDADRRIVLLGVDTQLYVTSMTMLRFGYLFGYVGLAGDASFTRGGIYGDVTQKLGGGWKVRAGAGQTHFDSRIDSTSDQMLVGFDLIRDFGWVQLSGQYYHDLDNVAGKKACDYFGLRGVLIL